jgi:putative hydrolase of the HAD superfamily
MSSKPILVFDLDDTLYDELSYVRGGLAVAAACASAATGCDEAALIELMQASLTEGRSGVIDRALQRAGIASAGLSRRCVSAYRAHQPRLSLYPAAERCLQRFSDYRKYLVTDGNKLVQARKVEALALAPRLERVFITYRYGRRHGKPSPYCFERISQITGAPAEDIIYVADNPTKDFVGIRPLGFGTIRVLTGQHATMEPAPGYDAALTIPDLDALTEKQLMEFHRQSLNASDRIADAA